jgi:hypothetical protein
MILYIFPESRQARNTRIWDRKKILYKGATYSPGIGLCLDMIPFKYKVIL